MQAIFDAHRLEKYTNVFLIGEKEFITSDNPVMFMDTSSLKTKPFSNGLEQNTTVFYFPISPKLLVSAYDQSQYWGTLSKYDEKLIFLESSKEQSFIKLQNRKQFEQCYNQVYSKNREVLEKFSL